MLQGAILFESSFIRLFLLGHSLEYNLESDRNNSKGKREKST